jgi:hypothetical protein
MKLADLELRLWQLGLVIYVCQGGLFQFGSTLSQATLVVLFALGFLNLLRLFLLGLNLGELSLLIFGTYIAVCTMLTWNGDPLQVDFTKNVLLVATTYFSASFYVRARILKAVDLQWFWVFGVILAIPLYYNYHDILVDQLGRSSVTNNIGYVFLAFYPIILLSERPVRKLLGTLVVAFFVFQSIKRGAIFLFILVTIMHGLKIRFNINIFRLSRYVKRTTALLLLATVSYFVTRHKIDLSFISGLENRFSEDAGARPANYLALMKHITSDLGIEDTLFGVGCAATSIITPEMALAHNDWLEVVVDFGFIGLTLYILWFLANVKLLLSANRKQPHVALILVFSWIALSTYSMWFNTTMTAIYMLSTAFCQAKSSA